jgi:hypothetical protein
VGIRPGNTRTPESGAIRLSNAGQPMLVRVPRPTRIGMPVGTLNAPLSPTRSKCGRPMRYRPASGRRQPAGW